MERNKDFNIAMLRRNYTNPHELYNALRTRDGLYFDASSQCWLITSYSAIISILHDSRFSSQLGSGAAPKMASMSRQMLFIDGEEHLQAQRVISRSLAQVVKKALTDFTLFAQRALEEKREAGEMDLVSDFASDVSLLAIARVLGLPLDDREELLQVAHWSDTFEDVTSGYFRGREDMKDISNLESYFRRIIATKKRNPSEDLLSAFIAAKDVFPEEEDLIANSIMTLAAGRATTKKLLGNGVPKLLQQWEHFRRQHQQDTKSFSKFLSEELFRVVTPTRYLIRQAREDVDLNGQFPGGDYLIHRGESMLLYLEAGNYDPAIFPDPEQFDPYRRPNRHIAFGNGSHQCPGASMARFEVQAALEVLLPLSELYPKEGGKPTWNPNPNLGGYSSYPVRFRM